MELGGLVQNKEKRKRTKRKKKQRHYTLFSGSGKGKKMAPEERHVVPTPGCRCDACVDHAKRRLADIMNTLPDPKDHSKVIHRCTCDMCMQEVVERYEHLNSFTSVEGDLA